MQHRDLHLAWAVLPYAQRMYAIAAQVPEYIIDSVALEDLQYTPEKEGEVVAIVRDTFEEEAVEESVYPCCPLGAAMNAQGVRKWEGHPKPSSSGPCVRLPDRMGMVEGSPVACSARYARDYAAILMAWRC